MLSISPTSPDMGGFAPKTAASTFALRGYCYAEKVALPIICEKIPDATLTPADIPWDCKGDGTLYPHIFFYKHVPTITLMRGGRSLVVKGPVTPIAPRITEATAMGWKKWRKDSAKAAALSTATAKANNAKIKKYFEQRQADKDAKREAKYQRACERAHRHGKPTPPRPAYKRPPDHWYMFIKDPVLRENLTAIGKMEYNADRRRRFVHKCSNVAGRPTQSFVEEFKHPDGSPSTAFRTALNITSFALFNSALPKGSISYGFDKTTLHSSGESGRAPMDVRDMEYIVVDGMRRCMFVVDLDGWWVDIDTLLTALRKFLLPEFMPNFVVYRGCEKRDGVENPHLIFLLPPGARVIREKGKDKRKQFKLHSMIQRAIVNHLLDLGADPCHTNVDKMKNPLTAKWSVAVQDESFTTMDEWRSFLPTITPDLRAMKAKAKKVKAARTATTLAEVNMSSVIWNDAVAARSFLIRAAQRTQDPTYITAIKTHAGFVDWLYHPVLGVVTRRLIHLHSNTQAVRSVLRAQREFVEQLGETPGARGQFWNRGRDREYNLLYDKGCAPDHTSSTEEREDHKRIMQSRAGRRSREFIRDLHLGLIAEEVERRMATGLSIDEVHDARADVIKTLDSSGLVARSTAYRLWSHVVEIVSQAARYQAVPSDAALSPVRPVEEVHQPSVCQVECGSTEIVPTPSVQPVSGIPVVMLGNKRIDPLRAPGIRQSWRAAVANRRKVNQRIPATVDMVHLDPADVDDPIVRAVLIEDAAGSSGWSRTRHGLPRQL
ncbi:hypothetical protein V1291_003589 [Nitrobacteraceae bacterium AZCC 1564]